MVLVWYSDPHCKGTLMAYNFCCLFQNSETNFKEIESEAKEMENFNDTTSTSTWTEKPTPTATTTSSSSVDKTTALTTEKPIPWKAILTRWALSAKLKNFQHFNMNVWCYVFCFFVHLSYSLCHGRFQTLSWGFGGVPLSYFLSSHLLGCKPVLLTWRVT